MDADPLQLLEASLSHGLEHGPVPALLLRAVREALDERSLPHGQIEEHALLLRLRESVATAGQGESLRRRLIDFLEEEADRTFLELIARVTGPEPRSQDQLEMINAMEADVRRTLWSLWRDRPHLRFLGGADGERGWVTESTQEVYVHLLSSRARVLALFRGRTRSSWLAYLDEVVANRIEGLARRERRHLRLHDAVVGFDEDGARAAREERDPERLALIRERRRQVASLLRDYTRAGGTSARNATIIEEILRGVGPSALVLETKTGVSLRRIRKVWAAFVAEVRTRWGGDGDGR